MSLYIELVLVAFASWEFHSVLNLSSPSAVRDCSSELGSPRKSQDIIAVSSKTIEAMKRLVVAFPSAPLKILPLRARENVLPAPSLEGSLLNIIT
jgi:hypothetical protein